MKTRVVLWPKRAMINRDSPIVHDDDFAGPLLFCLVLGTLLLFKGKVHFGTILFNCYTYSHELARILIKNTRDPSQKNVERRAFLLRRPP